MAKTNHKAKRAGRNPLAWRRHYLAILSKSGDSISLATAARTAQISPEHVARLKTTDSRFAEQCKKAMESYAASIKAGRIVPGRAPGRPPGHFDRARFLDFLAESGSCAQAARLVGWSPSGVAHLRRNDPILAENIFHADIQARLKAIDSGRWQDRLDRLRGFLLARGGDIETAAGKAGVSIPLAVALCQLDLKTADAQKEGERMTGRHGERGGETVRAANRFITMPRNVAQVAADSYVRARQVAVDPGLRILTPTQIQIIDSLIEGIGIAESASAAGASLVQVRAWAECSPVFARVARGAAANLTGAAADAWRFFESETRMADSSD